MASQIRLYIKDKYIQHRHSTLYKSSLSLSQTGNIMTQALLYRHTLWLIKFNVAQTGGCGWCSLPAELMLKLMRADFPAAMPGGTSDPWADRAPVRRPTLTEPGRTTPE